MTFSYCLRARNVQAKGVPFDRLGKVRPYIVEILLNGLIGISISDIARLNKKQRVTLKHGIVFIATQQFYSAADWGCDHMLHLHGFHDQELLTEINS